MDYFCPICSNTLLNYGNPFYQMFKRILNLHVNNQMMTYDEEDILHLSAKCIIKFMESKELIISSEISPKQLIVKLNLKKIHFHQSEKTFCFNKGNDHFQKQELFQTKKYPDRKFFLSG